jgi:tryptophan synthase alpha chain
VLFTYYNPIFNYGVERFSGEALQAGVDGILLLDLPPEEIDAEWKLSSEIHRISLIAPTTPEARIRKITENSSGFIYYVSREGVTGMQSSLPTGIERQLNCIRQSCSLPICVGFGISNPEQAASVAQHAEGVVVGSAIVDRIGEWGDQKELPDKLFDFVRPMVEAINGDAIS